MPRKEEQETLKNQVKQKFIPSNVHRQKASVKIKTEKK